MEDIYRSYDNDDARLRKQIGVDYNRMNIIIDYEEPQTVDEIYTEHPMLRLVCTQSSFFIMFHVISAVYAHGDNHVTDISTQGPAESFIDIERFSERNTKRASITLSRMFGVVSPARSDNKYLFKILAKLYIDIRLYAGPLWRSIGRKQTEVGLLSWTIC
jgi:hypothetical protein